jgi:hypothetical protein
VEVNGTIRLTLAVFVAATSFLCRLDSDSLSMITDRLSLRGVVALANTGFLLRNALRPILVKLTRFGVLSDQDSDLGVDMSGLVCTSTGTTKWAGGRSNFGVVATRSVCYFEATQVRSISVMTGRGLTSPCPGLMRVGWSTSRGKRELGNDDQGFGFGGTGKKSNNGQFVEYGEPFSDGDTIGCLLDGFERTISFAKNGIMFGVAFELPRRMDHVLLYPAVWLKGCTIQLNFGPAFLHPSPCGYCPPYPLDAVLDVVSTSSASCKKETLETLRSENAQLRAELARVKALLADKESLIDAICPQLNDED